MKVEEIRELGRFHELGPQWRQLLARIAPRTPFASQEWLEAWYEAFARRPARMMLVVVWEDGELAAAAPLVARRLRLWGVPLATVESAANLHVPRFDFLLPANEPAATRLAPLLDHVLASRPDVLFFKDLRAGSPPATTLAALADERGLHAGVENERPSPRIAVSGTWPEYLRRRSKNFRSALTRYDRRWTELGGVLEVVDDPARAGATLEEGLALEASGWKGRGGTAILGSPEETAFYRGLVARTAPTGSLRQYVLRLGGRAVAWDLCLVNEGVCYVLKTAYDESLRAHYPGYELQRRELVGAFSDPKITFWDLLPPDGDFKRRWCDDYSIELHSLRLYTGSPRARLAYLLYAQLRPWLGRSPLLRRLKQRVGGA